MSSFDVTSPVVRELRAARPRAPEQLRERVTALSVRPEPRPRFSFSMPSRFTVRRVALVAAPALVAVGVGGALIHGIANSGSSGQGVTQAPAHEREGLEAPTGPTSTVPVYDAGAPRQRVEHIPHALRSAPYALSGGRDSALAPFGALAPSKTWRL
jgi:hypothetical protein